MKEDLGTPRAIAGLFEVAHRAGGEISASEKTAGEFASLAEVVGEILTIFGFDLLEEQSTYRDGIHIRYEGNPDEALLKCVAGRATARRNKDWATADALRDELQAAGWTVEDTLEGPILSRA
jgi:cysteinyl-tRNA synthetase